MRIFIRPPYSEYAQPCVELFFMSYWTLNSLFFFSRVSQALLQERQRPVTFLERHCAPFLWSPNNFFELSSTSLQVSFMLAFFKQALSNYTSDSFKLQKRLLLVRQQCLQKAMVSIFETTSRLDISETNDGIVDYLFLFGIQNLKVATNVRNDSNQWTKSLFWSPNKNAFWKFHLPTKWSCGSWWFQIISFKSWNAHFVNTTNV